MCRPYFRASAYICWVKVILPSSRGAPQHIHFSKSLRVDSWGRGEVSRAMTFFELMETAQAILVSLILTDGSAQAVLHALDALKVVIRNLK